MAPGDDTTSTTDTTSTRKVGDLARATGLTVRTLHHYEQIGLLVASGRSEAGHRLYTAADVERLYRICLLRRLGFGLPEVAGALADPAWDLHAAMASQLRDLDRRLEAVGRLRKRIVHLQASTPPAGTYDTTDIITLIEEMTMLDTTVQRRISILVYEDLEGAFDFLTNVFLLGPGELTRDGDDRVVHGELQAGDGVVWLHPEAPDFQLASPKRLGGATATMAVMVDDVDAHHRHAVAHGARIDAAPVDQPYGYREYSARDPEGGLWSFMRPLD